LTKRQDHSNASDERCNLLGDLAARAAEDRPPELRQWAAIEQTLAGGPGFWRRRGLVLVFPALAGLAFWIAAGQTLGHKVQGCSLASDGSFSVPDDRVCTVEFDEGTRITLAKAARGQVRALGFRRGARLALHSGHADLSVVHRLLARWEVLAGPFQVRVTGTHFEVGWAPGQGRFSVEVREGEVSVNGGPLRDRTVSGGHRLDVDTSTGDAIADDLGAGAPAAAVAAPTAAAESPERAAAAGDTAPAPAAHGERKRGAPSRRMALRHPASAGRLETPAPGAEPGAATPELAPRDWAASSAADDKPAPSLPGPRRLTIGKNGELVGGITGPVRAFRGSGTRFSQRTLASAKRLYLDDGRLCTSGKMSQLACVDEAGQPKRCDWDTNWGVLIRWNTREDQKAWGNGANSSIALEFRGGAGRYRLVAHREGDASHEAFCIENYRSGQRVTPSEFKNCSAAGGSRLPDFTKVDYFALQLLSEEAWVNFGFCLSAISLF
jgi:hypothetical protein